ncbi:MAG: bifunctional proline dehydrogenase/L-glutamate gamma-semialdehyde dehydrogenase PutA [Alphaproteobacteria bacterium]|nr:bifunctional proline dehydrogenase/L-glutamate gamma-semialdehyde dehydrogenase PutA [Alphaproteobacteria bacterium]
MSRPSQSLKDKLNAAYHLDEDKAVDEMLALIKLEGEAKLRIRDRARGLIQAVRDNRKRFGGLDKFLQEFGLTTNEGIALMCLAEALLRIPDSMTADKLIRDKIGGADWDKHIGKADDLFVNASTWALMLTGKVISDVDAEDKGLSVAGIAGKMVSKLGEPVVRQAMLHSMKIMGQQFVMGRTIEEALKRAEGDEKIGYRHSYDMLGEGARTAEDAERYFKSYETAIDAIGKAANGRSIADSPGLSVKLSALHPRYEYAKRDVCVPMLSDKLLALSQKCAKYGVGLTVDAEEAHRLEISMEIIENVFSDPSLKDWEGFGLAIQAYQKRCAGLIDWLAAVAEENSRRMMVRLVKGAYWDSEVKYAQVAGLPGYPVYTRKYATDVSYLANATKLLSRRDIFYPMLASHNAYTVAAVMEIAGQDQTGFEFQRLHGMGEPLYHQIVGKGEGKYPCRLYAPVGSHQDLLPYLVRRLLENGANTSFVNRLQNDSVPIEEMLTDPMQYMSTLNSKAHPKIPLPEKIYGAMRKNSEGVEFANSAVSDVLIRNIEALAQTRWHAAPLIGGEKLGGKPEPVFDPADNSRQIGTVAQGTEEDIKRAVETTYAAFPAWNETPAHERAQCLRRMADLMQENMAELIALCTREAGKTLGDGVAEVREAIDFCRYYAAEGRKHFGQPMTMPGPTGELNQLSLQGRGVFLCISPWNFPLAIFIGQVTAALMAGNAVIAKPAGQTSLIAMRAVELLIEAGVPKDVIALLPVSGRLAGQLLVPDARIAGICLTGSTETAQTINRTLAERAGAIVPLIAETGGQNAMIVDSSALPEQIVDDVIISAFRSAGQRCSALRVLFVADSIADKLIEMLAGACKELTLDDPLKLSTDIGPVIDKGALEILEEHAKRMDGEGKKVAAVPMSEAAKKGSFFAPCAYEIKSMDMLTKEVFGPILHIVRYKPENLDAVIDQINATGFGLTFGLHTRIDHVMRDIVGRVNAGNCYVNRSMIGAVVGVQPFGGNGLSGTGPKAGGPHYLLRFANEKTLTVNTTASGGNTTLVSLTED